MYEFFTDIAIPLICGFGGAWAGIRWQRKQTLKDRHKIAKAELDVRANADAMNFVKALQTQTTGFLDLRKELNSNKSITWRNELFLPDQFFVELSVLDQLTSDGIRVERELGNNKLRALVSDNRLEITNQLGESQKRLISILEEQSRYWK